MSSIRLKLNYESLNSHNIPFLDLGDVIFFKENLLLPLYLGVKPCFSNRQKLISFIGYTIETKMEGIKNE
ncbi:hypothetical protein CJ195_15320 [Bacillus sp. UMB0899]|nr:hypothetical protein CJ195_15320 [Bacillus sp. UMB0899]